MLLGASFRTTVSRISSSLTLRANSQSNFNFYRNPTLNHRNITSSWLVQNITLRAMSTILPADRVKNEKESVWNEFIQLALEEKPEVNLGQGLPDYRDAVPSHVKDNLIKAVSGPNYMLNQYTRGFGHPRLVNALSQLYSKLIQRTIDPRKEILVTIGAYESIYCSINAFINKDDEVLIIEPFFDCYEPMVRLAGGKCIFVPLRLRKSSESAPTTSADWRLDMSELESSITSRTKMLILNTPHNPIGKVFSRQELQDLAQICNKHNLIVLSDEVYEHLVIDGEHVRIASLPTMWDRTLTVGSAGKTFSVTGWKLGWCYGPEHLMKYVQLFHQNCIYTCPTPIQEAVAESIETETALLGTENSYWSNLALSLRKKRDLMVDYLRKVKLDPTIPEGGYFLLANTSAISSKYDFSQEHGLTKDHRFVRWLTKNKKLQGIPPSAFYSLEHKNLAEDYIRLCYFKDEETLKQAGTLLSRL